MSDTQGLIISQNDFDKLTHLVARVATKTSELLEDELNRALIVEDSNVPLDTVTMNSVVTFFDELTNKEHTAELVYPNDVGLESENQKISIFAPIGAALIGLKVGASIDWPLPNGKTKGLKVLSVKRPE